MNLNKIFESILREHDDENEVVCHKCGGHIRRKDAFRDGRKWLCDDCGYEDQHDEFNTDKPLYPIGVDPMDDPKIRDEVFRKYNYTDKQKAKFYKSKGLEYNP
jgi:predicted RNA-binding Zn-ribbon protein involved in translation (DUF1610 family)